MSVYARDVILRVSFTLSNDGCHTFPHWLHRRLGNVMTMRVGIPPMGVSTMFRSRRPWL